MAASRGRHRASVLAAFALAFTIAGAAARPTDAAQRSTITFGTEAAGFSVSTSGYDAQTIEFNLEPDAALLPRKIVVEAPAGYDLDLSAKPGTRIASAFIGLSDPNSPSFAVGAANLTVADGASDGAGAIAQTCAPGPHLAVWTAEVSIAGQPLKLTIFVDRSEQPSLSYVLQVCPSGGASAATKTAASITLNDVQGLIPPTHPGRYVWRATVFPHNSAAYELQAVLPLPESTSLHVRYDKRTKTALLTGKVTEAGDPVAGADVYLSTRVGNETHTEFDDVHTDAQGAFSLKRRAARTTDFSVSVGPTVGPCPVAALAPGGCLAATTVPPLTATATVWVSVRGGAVRSYRGPDQRRAGAINVGVTDVPDTFHATAGYGDDCLNQGHEAGLTITGESTSQTLFDYDTTEPGHLMQVSGLARVYATAKQARLAALHEARAKTVRCELSDIGAKLPPIAARRLPKIPVWSRGFRAVLTDPEQELSAKFDFIFLQRGRNVVFLRFVSFNIPDDELEEGIALRVASRMR